MHQDDVERALDRPGQYFFEDGLWEIVVGLWLILTVAIPSFIGGAVGNWAPVVVLLSSLLLRPAVLAAKGRWVYPRTGHVTYPEDEVPRARTSLGLSPATDPFVSPVPSGRAALVRGLVSGTSAAILAGISVGASRRPGPWDAGGQLAIGIVLGGCLLAAAVRWKQRRWIVLAATLALLALLVALSGLSRGRALACHSAGIAGALVVSGTVAFVTYRRRTQAPETEPDGR